MNNISFFRNPITFGLMISFFCHITWLSFFIPVINSQAGFHADSRIIFLGAILKDSDFLLKQKTVHIAPIRNHTDFKDAYTSGKMAAILDKPALYPGSRQQPRVTKVNSAVVIDRQMPPVTEISFGFNDFSNFISGVDFSDLRKNTLREDLGDVMAVQVLIGEGNRVVDVRKVLGSGDPLFDFYVMLKLRSAVIKNFMITKGLWIHINFKIK